MILPPALRAGARVALVAPAGPVAAERIDVALARCAAFGFEPVLGAAAGGRHAGYLAGTDAERLADLRWALGAPDLDAVWALRGGYGTMRVLAQLDLSHVAAAPRPYIGFSDNTAVLLALHARGVTGFHGPHAGGDMSDVAVQCFRSVLCDGAAAGILPQPEGAAPVELVSGVAEGPLLGGNLSMLAALCGTPAAPRAAGCILFLEDIGEPLYRLDRLWMQLVLSGALDDVAGIAFGHFTDCGVAGAALHAFLQELAAPLGVPALAGLPIGHEADNWTLPLGVRARLDARAGTLSLLEGAVA